MAIMKEYAGRILMLNENSFPGDQRVANEAFTLAEAGYRVSVIALRKRKAKSLEDINGVRVYRIPQMKFFKNNKRRPTSMIGRIFRRLTGVAGYLIEYFYFTAAAFYLSLFVWMREGFDVIHAHNPPDTLFIVGAFFKIFGKKFVFDHHDVSPELYQSRFGKQKKDLVYRGLMLVEKLCYLTANVVIATNESYKKIAVRRGRKNPDSVFVVRNGPNLDRVRPVPPDEELRKMNKTILGYVGALNPQDGVDYLVRALGTLVHDLGRKDVYCVVVGYGDSLEGLKKLACQLEIEDHIHFTGYCSDADLVRYLSSADICVDPDPSSPLNDVSTWIKIMEYMALGKPIVSFDLPESIVSAQDAALFVPANDEKAFAEAIERLMDDPELRGRMGAFGYERIQKELAWVHVSRNLVAAYASLFEQSPKSSTMPSVEVDTFETTPAIYQ